MKSPFFEFAKGMLLVSAMMFTGLGLFLAICILSAINVQMLSAPLFSSLGLCTMVLLISAQAFGTMLLLQTPLFKRRREEWRQFAIRYNC